MEIIEILRGVELFDGLNDEQLHKIAQVSHEETYQRGQAIFRQGDAGHHLYIIDDGQVQIDVRNADGENVTKLFLGTGQIFGEIALIDYGPRTADVIASHDNTRLYVFAREDIEALYTDDRDFGFILMRNLAADIAFKLRHENLQR